MRWEEEKEDDAEEEEERVLPIHIAEANPSGFGIVSHSDLGMIVRDIESETSSEIHCLCVCHIISVRRATARSRTTKGTKVTTTPAHHAHSCGCF